MRTYILILIAFFISIIWLPTRFLGDFVSASDENSAIFPPTNSSKPFVIVQYHSFYFDWPLTGFATYMPKLEGDYYFRNLSDSTVIQHINWAKEYGIDAFALSWYVNSPGSPPNQTPRNYNLLRVIELFEKYGMKWFFLTETEPLKDSPPGSRYAFALDLNKYKNYKTYLKSQDARPLVMTYASQELNISQLREFRNYLEKIAGKVYLIGDVYPIITSLPYKACHPQVRIPTTYYNEVHVRVKSQDGNPHDFTLYVFNQEAGKDLINKTIYISSKDYQWYNLGWFNFNGLYSLRISDNSGGNLAVDQIKLISEDLEIIKEAEGSTFATVIDDSLAGNSKAVTRSDPGVYFNWIFSPNHRSPIDKYNFMFDVHGINNIPIANYDNVQARVRSQDGNPHDFTLYVFNQEAGRDLISQTKFISSKDYQWYDFGGFNFDGSFTIRISDASGGNLAVDQIKLISKGVEITREAEGSTFATVIDDSLAGNGKAVTRRTNDPGVYFRWIFSPNPQYSIDEDYFSSGIFDAYGGYNIPAEIKDYRACIENVYQYLKFKGVYFLAWATPGFNCKYSRDCIWTNSWPHPYPSKENFESLLWQAKGYSNVIFISNWNDFIEGSNIEPTIEQGDEFLKTLKNVVCGSSCYF